MYVGFEGGSTMKTEEESWEEFKKYYMPGSDNDCAED